MSERASLAKQRVAQGLCPRCGEEAAPYRLCRKHRDYDHLSRILDRAAYEGGLTRTKIDGRVAYSLGNRQKLDAIKWRPDAGPNDKRRRPRLAGIPVDIERQIITMLATAKRPCSIEEIVSAWGRLRGKRGDGTIAGNVLAIVAADQKRADKNAKRARAAGFTREEACHV